MISGRVFADLGAKKSLKVAKPTRPTEIPGLIEKTSTPRSQSSNHLRGNGDTTHKEIMVLSVASESSFSYQVFSVV